MQYILQQSEKPNHWVCTDTENGIVCIFENHKFNDTQSMMPLDDFPKEKYFQLAAIMGEMGDWLRKNHYDKMF